MRSNPGSILRALRKYTPSGKTAACGYRPDFSYDGIEKFPGGIEKTDKLLFVHLEKTAGTSLNDILSRHFESDEVCPERLSNISLWSAERLKPYRYYAPHASLRMLRDLPRPIKTVTMLREPTARLWSHYNSWRFLRDAIVEGAGLDHIKYMRGLKISDMFSPRTFAILPDFWNLYAHRLGGDLIFSPSGRAWVDEEEMLETAAEHLANMTSVGITEYSLISFQFIADDMSIPNFHTDQKLNQFVSRTDLSDDRLDRLKSITSDDEIISHLQDATRLDSRIYSIALQRFLERLRKGVKLKIVFPEHLRSVVADGRAAVLNYGREGVVVYGPYCRLPAGAYRVTQSVRIEPSSSPGKLIVDVCSDLGATLHAERSIDLIGMPIGRYLPIDLDFTIEEPNDNVEFRLSLSGNRPILVEPYVTLRRM